MGIITSRNIKYENETVGNTKIPKHLQPLKRKQIKKRSSESISTIVNNNPQKNNKPKSLSNNKISSNIIDYSTLNNQFRWSNGRRFPSDVSGINLNY